MILSKKYLYDMCKGVFVVFIISFFVVKDVFCLDTQKNLSIHGMMLPIVSITKLNKESAINSNNILNLNQFESTLKTDLSIQTQDDKAGLFFLRIENNYIGSSFLEKKGTDSSSFFVKEAFYQNSLGWYSLRIGKQFLEWSYGLFFNPSDIVNLEKDPMENKNEQEKRGGEEGRYFICNDFFPTYWLSLRSIVPLEDIKEYKQIPVILRINFILSELDFSVFAHYKEKLLNQGVGFSYNPMFLKKLVIYSEAMNRKECRVKNISKVNDNYMLNEATKDDILTYLIGLTYTVRDKLILSAEYYYDNKNWTSDEFKDYLVYLISNKKAISEYKSLSNSKDYFCISSSLINLLDNLNLELNAIVNLSDKSKILSSFVDYTPFDNSTIMLKYMTYLGNDKTEFGESIEKNNLSFSLRVNF